MDLDALRSAGLYDPAAPGADERRTLLEFLAGEGCTVEEMEIAHSRGRLFALAGDRRIRPVVGLLTLREAATRLQAEPAVIARAWRTFGLPDSGLDAPLLTEAESSAMRIVKFLGDAVMWVSAEPEDLAHIASDLATHPRAAVAEIGVRAGIAYGRLLAQDGDYFGPPVNLASRLVSVAEPGQVLAAGELVEVLGAGWLAVPGVAQAFRGFDEPITPFAITPG